MSAFTTLLEQGARKLGSQAALAEALGIDAARISRLKRGTSEYGRLNVENCLRLAAVLDEWPATVLRAAGHVELAALFERLSGPEGNGRALKTSEWELLRIWRDLPLNRRTAFLNLLKTEGGPATADLASRRPEFPRRARAAGRPK
jgi:transcriptional regulator with XRE-family HTH domain